MLAHPIHQGQAHFIRDRLLLKRWQMRALGFFGYFRRGAPCDSFASHVWDVSCRSSLIRPLRATPFRLPLPVGDRRRWLAMAFASPVAGSVFITPYELTESNEWPRKPAACERFLLKGLSPRHRRDGHSAYLPIKLLRFFPLPGQSDHGFFGNTLIYPGRTRHYGINTVLPLLFGYDIACTFPVGSMKLLRCVGTG